MEHLLSSVDVKKTVNTLVSTIDTNPIYIGMVMPILVVKLNGTGAIRFKNNSVRNQKVDCTFTYKTGDISIYQYNGTACTRGVTVMTPTEEWNNYTPYTDLLKSSNTDYCPGKKIEPTNSLNSPIYYSTNPTLTPEPLTTPVMPRDCENLGIKFLGLRKECTCDLIYKIKNDIYYGVIDPVNTSGIGITLDSGSIIRNYKKQTIYGFDKYNLPTNLQGIQNDGWELADTPAVYSDGSTASGSANIRYLFTKLYPPVPSEYSTYQTTFISNLSDYISTLNNSNSSVGTNLSIGNACNKNPISGLNYYIISTALYGFLQFYYSQMYSTGIYGDGKLINPFIAKYDILNNGNKTTAGSFNKFIYAAQTNWNSIYSLNTNVFTSVLSDITSLFQKPIPHMGYILNKGTDTLLYDSNSVYLDIYIPYDMVLQLLTQELIGNAESQSSLITIWLNKLFNESVNDTYVNPTGMKNINPAKYKLLEPLTLLSNLQDSTSNSSVQINFKLPDFKVSSLPQWDTSSGIKQFLPVRNKSCFSDNINACSLSNYYYTIKNPTESSNDIIPFFLLAKLRVKIVSWSVKVAAYCINNITPVLSLNINDLNNTNFPYAKITSDTGWLPIINYLQNRTLLDTSKDSTVMKNKIVENLSSNCNTYLSNGQTVYPNQTASVSNTLSDNFLSSSNANNIANNDCECLLTRMTPVGQLNSDQLNVGRCFDQKCDTTILNAFGADCTSTSNCSTMSSWLSGENPFNSLVQNMAQLNTEKYKTTCSVPTVFFGKSANTNVVMLGIGCTILAILFTYVGCILKKNHTRSMIIWMSIIGIIFIAITLFCSFLLQGSWACDKTGLGETPNCYSNFDSSIKLPNVFCTGFKASCECVGNEDCGTVGGNAVCGCASGLCIPNNPTNVRKTVNYNESKFSVYIISGLVIIAIILPLLIELARIAFSWNIKFIFYIPLILVIIGVPLYIAYQNLLQTTQKITYSESCLSCINKKI